MSARGGGRVTGRGSRELLLDLGAFGELGGRVLGRG